MKLHAVKHFYDNRLGMVSLEDDVLSIVRQVRERYGDQISVNLDPDTGWYHFVEACEDGTDRLIFSDEVLDARSLERLLQSDSHWRLYKDPYDASEREQDELKAQSEAYDREVLRDAGERLAHALKKDGVEDWMPLKVAIPRDAGP